MGPLVDVGSLTVGATERGKVPATDALSTRRFSALIVVAARTNAVSPATAVGSSRKPRITATRRSEMRRGVSPVTPPRPTAVVRDGVGVGTVSCPTPPAPSIDGRSVPVIR